MRHARLAAVSAALALLLPARAHAQAVAATARLPYSVEIAELAWPGSTPPPALHSFAWARTRDGKWLLLGGMTGGVHGFQNVGGFPPPSANFPKERLNDRVWLVDPGTGAVHGAPLSGLAPELAASLTVTNAQSVQVGDRLYVAGGYGYTSDGSSMTTWPTLSVVDVPATAAAVLAGGEDAGCMRQAAADELFRVAGGHLAVLGETFLLVFGHDFEGFYTPQSNGLYSYEVRAFRLQEDEQAIRVTQKRSFGSSDANPQFRRRDLNVVPAVRPDGTRGLTVYGGVFTPQLGAWRAPIEIDLTEGQPRAAVDATGFEQWLSQYECPTLVLWSERARELHTLFLGGLGEVYYHPATGFNRDEGVPFIDELSVIRRAADGSSRAYLPCDAADAPLRLPALLGANAAMILAPEADALFQDDVLALDRLAKKTLVGHVYGGIRAERGNGGPTHASDAVLTVTLIPGSAPAIPVRVDE